MSRITSCSRSDLVRKLHNLGFIGPFSGGKHSYMKKGKYKQILPNPHGKDISSIFVREILKQSGITEDEWLKN